MSNIQSEQFNESKQEAVNESETKLDYLTGLKSVETQMDVIFDSILGKEIPVCDCGELIIESKFGEAIEHDKCYECQEKDESKINERSDLIDII